MAKELLNINVKINNITSVSGSNKQIVMIAFDGDAKSDFFCGTIMPGGIDTQTVVNGKAKLSARYMLEGTDFKNQKCHIFIENNGSFENGFIPTIVTDSIALQEWEKLTLTASVEPVESGVIIKIFCKN